MKIFSAQLKGTTTVAEGANVSLTGSFSGSIAGIDINSTNTFTSSTTARLNSIETISASNVARINSLETTSASVDALNTTQNSRLDSLENKTGSLATTGSNTFYGTQTFSGSLYIKENLIVQGSSSLQNITASAVDIGTNKIILNVNNPAIRYAGISVYDSGSTSGTGSLFWDSVNNYWLYEHPEDSGAPYNSAILISGPKNTGSLGEESGLVTNYIVKSVGSDHVSSSAIYDDGTTIALKSNTELSGTLKVTGNIGIGVTNPSVKLQINDTSNDYQLRLAYTNSLYYDLGRNSANGLFYFSGSQAGYVGYVFTGVDGERMRIASSGYVGIGTTSPGFKLDVHSGTDGSIINLNTTRTGGGGFAIANNGSARLYIGSANWMGISGESTSSTAISLASAENSAIIFARNAATSVVETMRITNAGNVGIGITNPSVPLHILRYAGSSGTLLLEGNDNVVGNPSITFKNNNGGATSYISMPATAGINVNGVLYLTSGGNVGIGLTNPTTSKFEVNGTETIYGKSTINASGTYSNGAAGLTVESNSWAIVDANVKRQLQRSIGYVGDYEQHVILLHPVYNGTLIEFSKCTGTLYATRGWTYSGRINDTYEIDTATAYNSFSGALRSNSGVGKLYTCTYNGVKYMAIIPEYRTSAVQYMFDGYIANNTGGETLKLVSYRNSSSGTILNSEIYNSLSPYTENDTFTNGLFYPRQGIRFASGATTLNYYEEGTFTPTNVGSNFASVTPVWGRYVRIGNQITINCRWTVNANSTGKKYLVFNLPFAFYDNTNVSYTGAVSNYNSGESSYSSNVGTSVRNSSSSTTQQYVEAVYTVTDGANTLLFSMTYFTF